MAWVPGEELLKKVWESIDKLGTGMLNPAQIRRVGKAKADVRRLEMLNEATAQQDVAEVLAGRARLSSTGELIRLPTADTQPVLMLEHNSEAEVPSGQPASLDIEIEHHGAAREEARLIVEQARASRDGVAIGRLINLRETIRRVEEEVEQSPKGQAFDEEKKVNSDWLNEWREGAERTSSEEMRQIWARLLIEESKAAGSFSLRTLGFLRTLDPAEAKLIAHIAPLVMSENRVFYERDYLKSVGLDFGELFILEELGVLSGVSGLGLNMNVLLPPPQNFIFTLHKGRALLASANEAIKIDLQVLTLSRIGADLIRLGNFTTPQEYIEKIGAALREKGFLVRQATYLHGPNREVRLTGVYDL